MKLKSFRVKVFRSIVDSGDIEVDDDLTCLVGKNESGKTALLNALHRLNPLTGESFDLLDDYPRWLKSKHTRQGLTNDARPITATFELDADDKNAIAELLGDGVIASDVMTVSCRYDNQLIMDVTVDDARATNNLVERVQLSEAAKAALDIANLNFAAIPERVTGVAAGFPADEDGPPPIVAELENLAAKAASLGAGKSTHDIAVEILTVRLPQFFYFSEYQLLDGRIDLQRLAAVEESRPGATPDQTAKSLLKLANTTPAALLEEDYEDRKSELEAVSNELTEQVFEYWTQNPNLRVNFDVDRQIETNAAGNQRVAFSYLDVRVQDTRHQYTNNFSQRSSGFRWFFSFLAAFTEFEEQPDDVIVLRDEPGLSLHGKAQADLLRFINERLTSRSQVIYTTHSPFLVETRRISRVRIVEDKGPELGAVVSMEALTVDRDSLFPLEAALGYDISQHLFIGDTNLLVEGPSDFVYLDTMSRHMETVGRTALDPCWRILPAGSASNIPSFVALLGRELHVTVLVDSGTEGAGKLQAAIKAGRLDEKRLISINEFVTQTHADIEDLFSISDYLELYNEAFGSSLAADQLGPAERIIKRIETPVGHVFDHYQPALVLLKQQERILPALDDQTILNFEHLFQRINSTLDTGLKQ